PGKRIVFQKGANLVAIHPWHHDVKENEVWFRHARHFQPPFSIRGDEKVIVVRKGVHQNIYIGFGIVHYKYGSSPLTHRPPPSQQGFGPASPGLPGTYTS